jgi:PPOX class probable F420-dependent enzyme
VAVRDEELAAYELVDLVTFRRNGQPVPTPVRFAVENGRVLMSLRVDSGKVTRARANPMVEIGGHPDGPRHGATLRFLEGDEAARAGALLRRRHRFLFLQRLVLGRRPGRHVLVEATPTPTPTPTPTRSPA